MTTTLAYVSPTSGQYYVFEFDALLTEDHTLGAEVSQHHVERGANISDHVRPSLAHVTLRVAVSNTPLNRVTVAAVGPGVLRGEQASMDIYSGKWVQTQPLQVSGGYAPLTAPNWMPVVGGASLPTPGLNRPFVAPVAHPATRVQQVDGNGRFTYLSFDEPMNRTRAVFEILDAIRQQGIPLELTTELRHYGQMLLTNLSTSRDGTHTAVLDLTLQEFAYATTQQTEVKRRSAAKKKPVEARARPQTPQGKGLTPTKIRTQSSAAKAAADAWLE
jgi:hypothetical protein